MKAKRTTISIMLALLIFCTSLILTACDKKPKELIANNWYREYGNDKTECYIFTYDLIEHNKNIDEELANIVATYTVEEDNTLITKAEKSGIVSTYTFVQLKDDDVKNGLYKIDDDEWYVSENYLIYKGKLYVSYDMWLEGFEDDEDDGYAEDDIDEDDKGSKDKDDIKDSMVDNDDNDNDRHESNDNPESDNGSSIDYYRDPVTFTASDLESAAEVMEQFIKADDKLVFSNASLSKRSNGEYFLQYTEQSSTDPNAFNSVSIEVFSNTIDLTEFEHYASVSGEAVYYDNYEEGESAFRKFNITKIHQ